MGHIRLQCERSHKYYLIYLLLIDYLCNTSSQHIAKKHEFNQIIVGTDLESVADRFQVKNIQSKPIQVVKHRYRCSEVQFIQESFLSKETQHIVSLVTTTVITHSVLFNSSDPMLLCNFILLL